MSRGGPTIGPCAFCGRLTMWKESLFGRFICKTGKHTHWEES